MTPREAATPSDYRILVVDHEPTPSLVRTVFGRGVQIVVQPRPSRALAHLRSAHFDMLVVALAIPRGTALALLRRLDTLAAHPLAVVLTDIPQSVIRQLQLHVTAILPAHPDPEGFKKAVLPADPR